MTSDFEPIVRLAAGFVNAVGDGSRANKKPKQSVRTVWAFVPPPFRANPLRRSSLSIGANCCPVNKQSAVLYTFASPVEGLSSRDQRTRRLRLAHACDALYQE